MFEKWRISQGGGPVHISQQGRNHIFYDHSIELLMTREMVENMVKESMKDEDVDNWICWCDRPYIKEE